MKQPSIRGGTSVKVEALSGSKSDVPCTVLSLLGNFPSSNQQFKADYNTCILVIGSSNQATSDKDRSLQAPIHQGFDVLSQTTVYTANTYDGELALITRVIKNTSSNPMFVREIGIYGYWFDGNRECGNNFMIAREVLSETIKIQPGEKHAFTISLCID